jgi:hypothetical protein
VSESIWVVLVVVAICSYLAVKAWVNARLAEREAFYRSETLKKFAEMQGTIPESVLRVLQDAVKQKDVAPNSMNYNYNREREAYYRSETVKKIAETGGASAALEYLREDEKKAAQRRREGLKLGGAITAASGIALTVFLGVVVKGGPVYLAGLIPTLAGIAMVVFALTTAPTE